MDAVEQYALEVVNSARVAFGLPALAELPAGRPGQAGDCVLARALHGVAGMSAVNGSITFQGPQAERAASYLATVTGQEQLSPNAVKTHPMLQEFYSRFDNGKSPEYVTQEAASYH